VPTKVYLLIFQLSVSFVAVLMGCSPATSSSQVSGSNQTRKVEQATVGVDRTLIEQVRKFANDEGAAGQAAWETLNAYPRQELISSLTKIQKATPESDPLRVDIAFVLCNLDYEYQPNRQLIVSAFTKTNRHALGEERLISRLILRGDKELLPVLFSAVEWSDGAVSEGLSDTFAEQLRSDPEKFLLELKSEPLGVRQKVYALMDDSVLSEEDVKKVKKYLAALPRDSGIAPVAKEMLKALLAPHRQ